MTLDEAITELAGNGFMTRRTRNAIMALLHSRTPSHGRVSDSADGRLPDGTGLPMNGAGQAVSAVPVGIPDAGEPDMSWFIIAIDSRGEAVVLDYAPGWDDFGVEFYWDDTFASEPPKHLAAGAYLWTGFKVGRWDEDEHINVSGGEFTPYATGRRHRPETVAAPIPVEGEVIQADIDVATAILSAARGYGVKIRPEHSAVQMIAAHRRAFSGGVDDKVREALVKLEAAATLVTEWLDRVNDRDETFLGGPQWFELGRAVAKARTALSTIEEPRG